MMFRYAVMMSFFSYVWFILKDLASSVHLRVNVGASLSVAFLMYCWEIVEPPPVPAVAWLYTARSRPPTSKPEFVSNDESSVAIAACFMMSGIWSGLSSTRLPPRGTSLPIGEPSA